VRIRGKVAGCRKKPSVAIQHHVCHRIGDRDILSISLPSPLHPQVLQQRYHEVDVSICNLSSPAALPSDPLQIRPAGNWQPAAVPQVYTRMHSRTHSKVGHTCNSLSAQVSLDGPACMEVLQLCRKEGDLPIPHPLQCLLVLHRKNETPFS